MSRDLKRPQSPAGKRSPGNKSRGGTLIGIIIGLVLGVCAALAVVLYINKAPMPFVDKTQPPPKDAKEAAGNLANTKPGAAGAATAAAAPQAAVPVPLPGKPGDPVPEKRFQFYDILPGKAEPKSEPADKPAAKDGKETKEAAKEAKEPVKETALYLQAGSFQRPGDADNQKANLAMLGMEATVQQVMVGDKVWYRVRLGPYGKMDEVNRARSELAKAGIEASLAKNKD
ncbi:cell division protein [Oryzomicrobium terrae]|uniref:Cell division protein n=1 Tax=Oryzomicrobium terrae TaxID=1735038 RepID=A0A5C1E412_9RHOO|nr:SPOR domain-containing protein [Oryzomicrobium terrae]QEL63642.1 cell division protein [Oryzomicrobium terrae]